MRVDELDIPDAVSDALMSAGFRELHPPQAEAIPIALEGRNLVAAIPTASGKSLIGMIPALKLLASNRGKVLYIVPLKALAAEKRDDFQRFADSLDFKVHMSTGDLDGEDRGMADADVVIATSEKADSLIKHGSRWMQGVRLVIADEIHSDLIAPGHRHAVFASLGEAYAENCAVCHSPSKTFNLAGMSFSCIIIPDAARRKAFDAVYDRYCRAHPTFFAPVAAKAAWEQGEEWLEACLAYIRDNEVYVRDFAAKTWGNQVWIAPLEGTYLLWMDFHKLEPDSKELDRRMIQDAGVALDGGTMFGPGGEGFQRLNLAAPRAILQEIMERIAKAFPLPAN